jgi:CheY-like chemotaxis protein
VALISPSVMTAELSGRDDHFFRLTSPLLALARQQVRSFWPWASLRTRTPWSRRWPSRWRWLHSCPTHWRLPRGCDTALVRAAHDSVNATPGAAASFGTAGTGIGLTIVRQLTEAMRARCRCATNLPDIDGADWVAQLRADPAPDGVAVVGLSGDATPQTVQRARAAGAADYLFKPISVKELLDVVDHALCAGRHRR